MNYEYLNAALLPEEKIVKENLGALQKLYKAVDRERENGDIKSLVRDISAMEAAVSAMEHALEEIRQLASGFDAKGYFESGDFAEQMLAACEEKGVDVRGEFPVFEMFPYKVKLDVENQDVYLDRKKVQCMRPVSFVNMVKEGQEKLNKAALGMLQLIENAMLEVNDDV